MTGNTKVWRASLAGLASVAMIATMGVAASTANALAPAVPDSQSTFTPSSESTSFATVKIYDASYPYELSGSDRSTAETAYGYNAPDTARVRYGAVLYQSDFDGYAAANRVLDYLSYDQAGAEKATVPYVVTGDVKLYAHYKDSVMVTFDTNKDGVADAGDKSVKVAKGSALTVEDYLAALDTDGDGYANEPADAAGEFAGWTLTPSASHKGTSDLYNSTPITADTTLYPRYDTGENLAVVRFQEQDNTGNYVTRYTLIDSPFQGFRAPETWAKSFADASFAGWKNTDGSDYDFTKNVVNVKGSRPQGDPAGTDPDVTIIASKSNALANATVQYNFNGAYSTIGDAEGAISTPTFTSDVVTTADKAPVKPVAPVKAGYVFTGWYYAGTKTPVDFSKPLSEQHDHITAGNILKISAGWDSAHAAKLVLHLGYKDIADAQQVLYVYEGDKVDLPKGLAEYEQTAAQKDALKGEYTAKTLSGWYEGNDKKQVVTSTTAPKAGFVRHYTANWSGSASIFLDANGGNFGGTVTRKAVTKTDSQKWQDVVVEPTRDGYYFANVWKDGSGRTANLSDGTLSDGTKIADGTILYAQWASAPATDITSVFTAYPLIGATSPLYVPSFASKQQDYALYAKYAKSEAGWKNYVDTVYKLKDDFLALNKLSGTELYNAQKALAEKLQAAQEKLTDYRNPKGEVAVFRLYNPNDPGAGAHFYTSAVTEYNDLVRAGWKAEGIAFVTTEDGDPVYRAYNPNDGSHFYTLDKKEFDDVVKAGWKDENIAFRVSDTGKVDVYRLYNPNTGEHFYTNSKTEAQDDVKAGWRDENVAWKALR